MSATLYLIPTPLATADTPCLLPHEQALMVGDSVNDAQAAFDASTAQEIQNTNDLIYKNKKCE